MVTLKEEIKESIAIAPANPNWLAIVYIPSKEFAETEGWDELSGSPKIQRPYAGRHLQLPPTAPAAGSLPGVAMEARSLFLKPGTNLGISGADWAIALEADAAKKRRGEVATLSLLLEKGALRAIAPDSDSGKPGYRNFNSKTAISLINSTAHEEWLNQWMEAEVRAEVIKASNEQKARLLAAKKKAAA